MTLGGGGKRRTDPGYGQGQVSLSLDDEVLLDEEELTARLQATFDAPDYRPPALPSVATELMGLSQKPDVTFDEVTALLERDAMLTGQVMKLLASPVYAASARITSLKQAVMRIGLRNLQDIVLEAALNLRVFKAEAYTDTMERLRRHCTVTAHLSRIVCKYTAIEGDYAFLCGLLHDVGIAGILIALAEASRGKQPPDLIAIWPAVDRVHPSAAAQMARLWSLPPEVGMVLESHHQVMIQGFAHPLAATVCLADDIARRRGFGLVPEQDDDKDEVDEPVGVELAAACLQSHTAIDSSPPVVLAHAREALGLSGAQIELIEADAAELEERLAL